MLGHNKERMLHPAYVFLTGTTGYIGAFLLTYLLRETEADAFCLVRAKTPQEGLERIKTSLSWYRIWDDEFESRICPVIGDLGKPLLGLAQAEFSELAATIDTIYHCGALVNFTYPYSALKAPNVIGTQEVLRLACQGKQKAVHYLSTNDTLIAPHLPRPFYEVELPKQPNVMPDGYPLSKWVAEQMVTSVKARGVPVCIYRPGWTLGHTKTGASPTSNFLLQALKGFLQLGILPENAHLYDGLPVDVIAPAIAHLSRKEESLGKVFHFWSSQPIPYLQTFEWIKSFGYKFEIVPVKVAYERTMQVETSHLLYPLIPELFPWGNEELMAKPLPQDHKRAPLLECANAIKGIEGSGLEFVVLQEEQMHRMLSFLVDSGFLPPPDA